MNHTQMNPKDLNSPCRELFVLGLGFAVVLPLCLENDLSCASI